MDQPNIQEIIASLGSETLEDREAAAKQLRTMGKRGMAVEDGLIALRAAAREYPHLVEFQTKSN